MSDNKKGLSTGKKDFLRTLGFCLGYLPAVVIPRSWDRPVIDTLVSWILKLRPGKEPHFASRIAETLGRPGEGPALEAEVRNLYEFALEGPWARTRSLRRNGWRPELEVEGLEHVRASQEAGKGTLIWRISLGSELAINRAFWDAGIQLVHLSAAIHGAWSEAWIADKGIAPIYRLSERWHLKERVIIPRDRAMAKVMKTLLARLKENEVVAIVGDLRAAQNVEAPFLQQKAWFATGSPALAYKSGATLLPTYSVREGTGRYRVVIQEPIAASRDRPRKAFVEAAIQEFAKRAETAVARHPGSWGNWPKYWAQDGLFDPSNSAQVGA